MFSRRERKEAVAEREHASGETAQLRLAGYVRLVRATGRTRGAACTAHDVRCRRPDISYGVSLTDTYRLIAGQVARILEGAKPADWLILQPTKFELVVNLRTAKTLGLTIPEAFLLRADELIE